MKVRRAARLTLLSVVPVALGLPLQGQEAFRGWIGLHDDAQLAWLENENRLGDLCPEAATYDQCQREMSGPLLRVHDLYPEADPSSPRVGELLVVATPGRGLTAHFRPIGSDPIRSFVPDLFLQDWGYGPYFHQTLMDDRGRLAPVADGPVERSRLVAQTGGRRPHGRPRGVSGVHSGDERLRVVRGRHGAQTPFTSGLSSPETCGA